MRKREGEVMFKGRSWQWGKPAGGSTGENHPFRRKSDRMIKLAEKNSQALRQITIDDLVYTFGIPLGDTFEDPDGLSEIERFEEAHGLERRGVDIVMSAFTAARHDHEETPEGHMEDF